MLNKEVELLLEDLSGRLPYGVKFHYFSEFVDGEDPEFDNTITVIDMADWEILDEDHKEWIRVRQIMPYLRPMSSMTSKEWCEYCDASLEDEKSWVMAGNREFKFTPTHHREKYLNSHHFDYRGLIEKGLAIEAPEGMYN